MLESQVITVNSTAIAAGTAATVVALQVAANNIANGHFEESKITPLPALSGKRDEVSEFLIKLDRVFRLQPGSFALDEIKIAYVAHLLKGEAFKWYEPHARMAYDQQPDWLKSWILFRAQFEANFQVALIKESARRRRKELRESGSVSSSATAFQLLTSNLDAIDETKRLYGLSTGYERTSKRNS